MISYNFERYRILPLYTLPVFSSEDTIFIKFFCFVGVIGLVHGNDYYHMLPVYKHTNISLKLQHSPYNYCRNIATLFDIKKIAILFLYISGLTLRIDWYLIQISLSQFYPSK